MGAVSGSSTYHDVWRAVAVAQGCLNMAATGSIFAFNAYADALKATFCLKQSQVSLAATLCNFGFNLAFPAAFILDRFGPRFAGVIGLVFNVSALTLLWQAVLHAPAFSDLIYVLQILFFMFGFGSSFTNMSAMITNVKNQPPGRGGRVVGLLEASQSAGPALVSVLYTAAFAKDHIHDPENQDLAGFFMVMASTFATIHFSGFMFLRNVPVEQTDTLTINDEAYDAADAAGSDCDCADSMQDVDETCCEDDPFLRSSNSASDRSHNLFKDKTFHLILWPFLLSTGIQFLFITNPTIYLRSFNLEQYDKTAVILLPTAGVVAKLLIGVISDCLINRVPREVFILIANILQAGSCTAFIFYAKSIPVFFLTIVCVIVCNGVLWCLTPVTLSERYGAKTFGRAWGWIVFGGAIFSFAMQEIFAYNYQAYVKIEDSIYCYGLECFTISSSICAVIGVAVCVGNVALIVSNSRERRRNDALLYT